MRLLIQTLYANKIFKVFLYLLLFAVVLQAFVLFVKAGTIILVNNPAATDFLAFYNGASVYLQDKQHLYDLNRQLTNQQHILPVTKSLNIFQPFLNPPFTVWFLIPFALLPLPTAYAFWTAGNFLLICILCFLAVKQLHKTNWYNKWLTVFAICTFIPVLTGMIIGQMSYGMILIFLLTWIFLKKGWQFRSGLLLALLLIKPHFIILPLLAILVQRQKRFTIGLLTGIFVLVGVSFLTVGWDGMMQYLQLLQTASGWSSGYGIDIHAQHSIQTALLFITNASSVGDIKILWYLCIALIVVPTLYSWTKRYTFTSPQFAMQWCIVILATLLISPHTHFHDLVLLIVVGVIMGSLAAKKQIKLSNKLLFLIISGYVIALTGYLLQVYGHGETKAGWIIISVTYMLIFWGYLLRNLLKFTKTHKTI